MADFRFQQPWWLISLLPLLLAVVVTLRQDKRDAIWYSSTGLLVSLPTTWAVANRPSSSTKPLQYGHCPFGTTSPGRSCLGSFLILLSGIRSFENPRSHDRQLYFMRCHLLAAYPRRSHPAAKPFRLPRARFLGGCCKVPPRPFCQNSPLPGQGDFAQEGCSGESRSHSAVARRCSAGRSLRSRQPWKSSKRLSQCRAAPGW